MSLEINLFGPGYGESVVARVSEDKWVIIDSCVDSSGRSVPLEFLRSRNIDPAQVILIIASHWHDDHVRGISRLIEACPNARIVFGQAMTRKEFNTFVLAYHDLRSNDRMTSGTSELYKTLAIVNDRGVPGIKAGADRCIWRGSDANGKAIEIHTLSPSDSCNDRFLQFLAANSPMPGVTKTRAPTIRENETAIAVLIMYGDTSVLLGADLEETHQGWSDILKSTGRPQVKSSLFKIPHHGSQNGHHDGVWQEMLTNKPISIMAPYNKGHKLPKASDEARILNLSEKAYITQRIVKNITDRPKPVEKMINSTVRSIRPVEKKSGHIRAVVTPNGTWTIELNEGAYQI